VETTTGREATIALHNTLYVPGASNLMSVGKLADKGASVSIPGPDHALVGSGRQYFRVPRVADLYTLRGLPIMPHGVAGDAALMATTTPPPVAVLQLHYSYAHLNLASLQSMGRSGQLSGVPDTVLRQLASTRSLRTCVHCAHGKMIRRSRPQGVAGAQKVTTKSSAVSATSGGEALRPTTIIERVHSDTWGPAPVSHSSRYRYAQIYVHQATDSYFLFGLVTKDGASTLRAFQTVCATLKSNGHEVRSLLTDNGREYTTHAMEAYCQEQGILQQFSPPFRQDGNGRAERAWRTMLEPTVAMLHQSGLPKTYWFYAFEYVVYLRNRRGVPSPYEKLRGVQPHCTQVYPFGSLVMTRIDPSQRRKLDSRVDDCIMLMPAATTKDAYRVVSRGNVATGRVRVRADVLCLGDVFPFVQGPAFDVSAPAAGKVTLYTPAPMQGAEPAQGAQDGDDGPPVLAQGANEDVREHEDQELRSQEQENPVNANPDDNQGDVPLLRRSTRARRPAPLDRSSEEYELQVKHDQRRDKSHFAGGVNDHLITIHQGSLHRQGESAYYNAHSENDEPLYHEAMRGDEREQWLKAIDSELESHKKNGSFKVTVLPQGEKTVGSRWVFKKKRGRNGEVTRYKARLVVRGDQQVPGKHFHEVFSPTLTMTSFRLIMANACHRGWNLLQLDVATAFLIPRLPESERIYMRPPPGFDIPPRSALLLYSSIYGLRQASRSFNQHFDNSIQSLGLTPTDGDDCVYTMFEDGRLVLTLGLFVDDALLAGEDDVLHKVKKQLMAKYEMTDGGTPSWFLGIAVDYERSRGELRLSQAAYTENILNKYDMVNCNPAKTPAAVDRLTQPEATLSKEEADYMRNVPYRSAVGSLMYLMVCTRPDIDFAVIQVSKYVSNPSKTHWTAVKRIFRYLRGTKDRGISYLRDNPNPNLQGFVDADWGGDSDTRRSTTGFVFKMLGGAISWWSKLQRVIAMSSCEAELIALCAATKEALWFRKMLRSLGYDMSQPTVLCEDNQGAIAIATNNRGMSGRTKHVEMRNFFVREHVTSRAIQVLYTPSESNLADLMTKALGAVLFLRLVSQIGLDDKSK
jgi:transposase InsO family protein